MTGITSLVNAALSGTLSVTGLTSLVNAALSGTLSVAGLTSLVIAALSGTLSVTGLTSLVNSSVSGYLTCGTSTCYNLTTQIPVYSSASNFAALVGYAMNEQLIHDGTILFTWSF